MSDTTTLALLQKCALALEAAARALEVMDQRITALEQDKNKSIEDFLRTGL